MENTRLDLEKLGHKVRFYRQGKGWTITALAEKSGVSKAYISDLENGVAGKPNIQYVFAIAVALEVTLDELLEDAKPSGKIKSHKDSEELPPGDRLPRGTFAKREIRGMHSCDLADLRAHGAPPRRAPRSPHPEGGTRVRLRGPPNRACPCPRGWGDVGIRSCDFPAHDAIPLRLAEVGV